MLYLFIGQDLPAKDAALKRIKEESLPRKLEDFNLDVLYAEKLTLKELQEKLLNIPLNSHKRIVLIRDAQGLQKAIDDFIAIWAARQDKNTILILDIGQERQKAAFLRSVSKYAKVIRFKEEVIPSAFNLSRQIENRQAGKSLLILNQLIREGEPAERILGGLRYSLENNTVNPRGLQIRLRLLLNCDIEIKTGRLKPVFALEKLVVNLCALA
ncbi:MAG: hypothetical protein WC355_00390 [Candidatus Omnitrophota bacterium]|jgi:DNA polymerase III delta subunit